MSRTLTRRHRAPSAALLVLALALTGCGGDKKDDAEPRPASEPVSSGCTYKSGASSDAVTVTGDFGKTVKASYGEPLKATSLQRTVLTEGDGVIPAKNAVINVSVSMFNGKNGKPVVAATQKVTIGDPQFSDGLRASFECLHLGSRVVTTVPAKDVLGDGGNSVAGIDPADALVIVTDLIGVYSPPKAAQWSGAPSVRFAGRKSPVVAVPGGEPSADLLVHVIKAGTGAKVASGDNVTLNYKGINWSTGEVFDESYGKGKAPVTFPANQFVPGFTSAIVGQRAGAQLIVSIPPEFGYGETGDSPLAGQTMVFVIELQATAPAG